MIDTPNKNIPEGMSQSAAGSSQSGSSQSGSATRQAYETAAGKVREAEIRMKNLGAEVKERGSQIAGQAKDTINQAYQRASHGMTEGWDNAMEYSRAHPAKATLIAFGAGVGLGLMIAGNLQSRNRTRRLVPPIMNALSDIAREVFR
jgi:ElaB/YqjD/DUF883 family membrane-anchored ribosome-binding protein